MSTGGSPTGSPIFDLGFSVPAPAELQGRVESIAATAADLRGAIDADLRARMAHVAALAEPSFSALGGDLAERTLAVNATADELRRQLEQHVAGRTATVQQQAAPILNLLPGGVLPVAAQPPIATQAAAAALPALTGAVGDIAERYFRGCLEGAGAGAMARQGCIEQAAQAAVQVLTAAASGAPVSLSPIPPAGPAAPFATPGAPVEQTITLPTPAQVQQFAPSAAPTCPICRTPHEPQATCPSGTVQLLTSVAKVCQTYQIDPSRTILTAIPPTTIEATPLEEKQFCAYCDTINNSAYVVSADSGPRSPAHLLVGCGKDAAQAAQRAALACQPVPPHPPLDPSRLSPLLIPNLCQVDTWLTIDEGLRRWQNLGPRKLADFFRSLPASEPQRGWLSLLSGDDAIGKVVRSIEGLLHQLLSAIDQNLVDFIVPPTGCNPGWQPITLVRTFIGFLSKWFGLPLENIDRPLLYASNVLCPSIFPTAGEATQAYLSATIPENILKSWVEANGNCWEPWQRVVEAQRSKLGLGDLAVLRRREIINGQQFSDLARQIGFLRPDEPDWSFALTRQLPPLTEILRLMVRDVADERLVAKFGMDAEFDAKWAGFLKDWGHQQGVDDEIARASWRAHWSIPGPSQLYEMFHRLRFLEKDDPAFVDLDTIREALIQQDILPFWIPRLLAVSFRPLTRVDVRRAFRVGALDSEAVRKSYLDLGYSDENAKVLTKFAEVEKDKALAASEPVKNYRAGLVSYSEAEAGLLELGAAPERAAEVLALENRRVARKLLIPALKRGAMTADEVREVSASIGVPPELAESWIATEERLRPKERRKRCAVAVQKRMETMELSEADAVAELAKIGFPIPHALDLAAGWACEVAAKGKEATASLLCGWLEKGLIAPAEFANRLERSGWSREDAVRILTDCLDRLDKKLAKLAQARAREQEQAVRRDLARQQKTQKELERQARQAKQSLAKAQAAEQARDKLRLGAAKRLAKADGIEIDDAALIVTVAEQRLRANTALTPDERVQAVVTAAEGRQKDDPAEFTVRAQEAADAILTL